MNYQATSETSARSLTSHVRIATQEPVPAGSSPAIEHRLSRALVDQPEATFSSLANLPSNAQAIQAAERFAAGLQKFVALVGPSGWGKSHLLSSVAGRLGKRSGPSPVVFTATEWVLGIAQAEGDAPLLLDNVQDLLPKPRLRHALRSAIGERVRAGQSTMLSFTSAKSARSLRILLPAPRTWTWACIQAPEPIERVLVLQHMAAAEHLAMSAPLTKLLASRLRGNGRTLMGALKRLKLYGADWQDSSLTLRACGILDMFFRDDSDWDLRETVFNACRPGQNGTDLAMYLMLREAALSEAHVAQFFGVQPTIAYQRASALSAAILQSPELREEAAAASARAVRSLFGD
ncbi:MAG TPA: DnaA/Hda family protein [Fimbriimonadaceae bacterium]|nr:DnaA/Hda family protein [Fimbriimonadaceae bacterium]